MAERSYTPTMGMVRELARASLAEPMEAREPDDFERCLRRGLIDRRGGLTPDGQSALNRAVTQHRTFEASHGR